ncbi:MAG: EamA family transporter, partial [Dehalococcoidia bacterium]
MTDKKLFSPQTPGFPLAIALLIQQLLGALTFPVARYGLREIDPYTFAFFRFVISSLVLLFLVRIRRPYPAIDKKDYRKIFLLGAIIIPFNQTTYLVGQSLTAAGHGALLFATVPIW